MSTSGGNKPRLVADKRRKKPSKKRVGWGLFSGLRSKPASRKASGKKSTAKKTASKRTATRKRSQRSKGRIRGFLARIFGFVFRLIWVVSWRVTALAAVIIAGAVFYTYTTLPDVQNLLDGRARGSVTLMDREGEVFAWRGDQFGGVVTAETVSPHLKNAVVATEDKRFYRHFGISPRGVASAIRINLREGRGPLSGHGGSTITQQTAKLLCLGVEYDQDVWESEADYVRDCRRGSLGRKAKEAIYALAMEAKYSKDEILSIYMNRAYMGAGAYGAEAAAQRYFGKPASAVTAQESAMLAGLLTAPTRLAPTSNLARSQDRAATILRLMEEQGYLTAEERSRADANPATLSEAAEAQTGGYFADWVMESGPDFFTRDTTEDVIIRTTLDQRIQRAAEEALTYIFEEKVREGSEAQAAIVVMSADGAVRAMVGGRESKVVGGFNRATMANRQTGSAFKPFVYATALELGYGPNATVVDEPYCIHVPGSGQYCPENYDKKYRGRVTLTEALEFSVNVPAVKVSEALGRDLVRKVAEDFGIRSDLADSPSLALGASESTLLEMTGAYAGILNGGSSVTPYGLEELMLLGEETPLMGTSGGIGERVIREEAARQLTWMMYKVVSEGTARRARLDGWEVAGKTGTTQAARDAWFIGFTADYVTGVWMGNDDNSPLQQVTGGSLPTDIWRETMVRVNDGLSSRPLPMSRGIREQVVEDMTPRQPQPRRETAVERILRDILGR
ncbi:MAG: PBP1A family penicillin-binding protein [Pseudomonadota bacterium]